MKRALWTVGAAALVASVVAAASCTNTPAPVGLSEGCSINSDCEGSLVCAFSRCHVACAASKDCGGSECVLPGVCELKSESTCSKTLPCVSGLTCVNSTCRGACSLDGGSGSLCLPTQSCTTVSELPVCVDLVTTTADAGVPTSSCPNAQTRFGNIAQGDTNPLFTSGVGAGTAAGLFVFDGFYGPDPTGDGGGNRIGLIYAQAFDGTTGTSKGMAKVLLIPPLLDAEAPSNALSTNALFVDGAAVSPSGEIALTYRVNYSSGWAIYAAFFTAQASVGPGMDAGAAGLAVENTALLATPNDTPGPSYVMWSNASQAFVASWAYVDTSASQNFLAVAKFLPDGRPAGGSTDVVPTDNPSEFAYTSSAAAMGSVGESGDLLGVSYLDVAKESPSLTALDTLGNQVGSSFEVIPASMNVGGAWVAVGGTSQGFVYFYDEPMPASVGEVFVPRSNDAGIVGGFLDGGGSSRPFSGFSIPGAMRAASARAVGDSTGGVGGVGVALQYPDGISFAYVNADGVGHLGPDPVFAHSSTSGDEISMTNFAGSFVISLYNGASHATEVVASGCH